MAPPGGSRSSPRSPKGRGRRAPDLDIVYGRHPVLEAIKGGGRVKELLVSRSVRTAPVIEELMSEAETLEVAIKFVERSYLDAMTEGANHQGVVARLPRFRYADTDDLLNRPECSLLLLDGVTDPQNLGSMARTAEAMGFDAILIPKHQSVGVTPTVRKVAAGALERLAVARVSSAADAVRQLSKREVLTVGLDAQAETPHWEVEYPRRVCLVVGAEGKGLSRLARERCDLIVAIPMAGAMSSLNVSVAAAVVMVEVTRSRRLDNP